MTASSSRAALRRSVRLALAGTAILAAAHGAFANDDAGVHQFFSGMFGGEPTAAEAPQAPRAAPMPQAIVSTPRVSAPATPNLRYATSNPRHPTSNLRHPASNLRYAASYRHPHESSARPLTVRLHETKPTAVAAQEPTKPAKVSIFEDRTLRRGDAVMTAEGIRIFAGSRSWPYSPDDFVSLGEATHLNKDTTKVLAQLDRVPRG